ncbi:MAG: GMC family oxidoreductase N-terminal domain-containing protein [Bauldia sp.]|nr:GMC family oxidoreductase N-terminal domain-containing protein [Bauldia sp.]
MERFDVIVVGAGSGGGVAAARLTEDPDCRVLLLEAGPDFPREAEIPPCFTVSGEHSWKTAALPEFDWDFFNHDGAETLNGRSLWLPRGRLMGGTSMVNATIAARGAPFDFDRWAAMGNDGWSAADMLPFFIKIENDLDFGDQPIHGKDGPIVIQRYKPESWAPINRVLYDACVELGIREAPDLNAAEGQVDVVGVMPHNRYKEVRLGTLVTYIRSARKRPNLTIRARCVADKVLVSGSKAEGVVYIDAEGRSVTAHADQIIVSAGVYNTPAILQRSGIGPSAWLEPLGIEVVADLPVGRNLLDHPGFPMLFKGRGLGVTTGRNFVADVRGPGVHNGEPAWQTHPFPVDEEEGVAGFWTYLTRQDAEGEVIIGSTDPRQAPSIDHRYNTLERDRRNFADARSFCKEMLASATFRGHNAEWVDDIDQPIAEALAERMGAAHHQCGTAKMGPAGDPTAVVGADLRVHGFDNLRVADTSIYPDNVMNNTNLTALVVGERVAGWVAEALRH